MSLVTPPSSGSRDPGWRHAWNVRVRLVGPPGATLLLCLTRHSSPGVTSHRNTVVCCGGGGVCVHAHVCLYVEACVCMIFSRVVIRTLKFDYAKTATVYSKEEKKILGWWGCGRYRNRE